VQEEERKKEGKVNNGNVNRMAILNTHYQMAEQCSRERKREKSQWGKGRKEEKCCCEESVAGAACYEKADSLVYARKKGQ